MSKHIAALFLAIFVLLPALQSLDAIAATSVPPGNRNAKQPTIPGGSIKRTRGTTFEKKYKKIRNLLAKDRKLMRKIKAAADTHGIDPIHIIGALVGEHTYNVDAKDRLQSYYVKAMAYLGQELTFKHEKTKLKDLIKQPAFAKCDSIASAYDKWTCREAVWNRSYRGKTFAGKAWPNNRFGAVFFQPLYAGQTFGLGQLNPLTALKVNDMVRAKTRREPKLSINNAPLIYNTIMEPDSSLLYMAAVIRHAIDAYARIANFDISNNPGVTATLYNLGNVTVRAERLRAKNRKRKAAGQRLILPAENYYGWLINHKLDDLRSLL
jgi:hypothetical protein